MDQAVNERVALIQNDTVKFHYRDQLRQKMRNLFFSYRGLNRPIASQNISLFSSKSENINEKIEAALYICLMACPSILDEVEERLSMIRPQSEELKYIQSTIFRLYGEKDTLLVTDFNTLKETDNVFLQNFNKVEAIASEHILFLNDDNNSLNIEKAIKELLQNLEQHGNFSLPEKKRIGKIAENLIAGNGER